MLSSSYLCGDNIIAIFSNKLNKVLSGIDLTATDYNILAHFPCKSNLVSNLIFPAAAKL